MKLLIRNTLAVALGVAMVAPALIASPAAVNGTLGGFSSNAQGGQNPTDWGIPQNSSQGSSQSGAGQNANSSGGQSGPGQQSSQTGNGQNGPGQQSSQSGNGQNGPGQQSSQSGSGQNGPGDGQVKGGDGSGQNGPGQQSSQSGSGQNGPGEGQVKGGEGNQNGQGSAEGEGPTKNNSNNPDGDGSQSDGPTKNNSNNPDGDSGSAEGEGPTKNNSNNPDGDGGNGGRSGSSSSGSSSGGGRGGNDGGDFPPLDPPSDGQYDPTNNDDGQVPSGCAEAGSQCAQCVQRNEGVVQFNRRYLHVAWSTTHQAIEYANRAIAFGDAASGIHSTQALAWQLAGKPQITEALTSLRKTYDNKYRIYINNMEQALGAMNRCETENFAVQDLYQRFSSLYLEFVKARYQSPD